MADGATPNIGFGNCFHFDGGHHTGDHFLVFECIHEREGVHHRTQHAHVIGGCLIHPHFQSYFAAPKVAGANDNGDIDSEFADFLQAAGNILRLRCVDAYSGRSSQ